MKSALVLMTILISVSASAFDVQIYSDSARNVRGGYTNVHYELNVDLGRAWAKFDYQDLGRCIDLDWNCAPLATTYALVNGLSFDKQTQNIVYSNNGQNTVCAETYVKRSWTGTKRVIVPTGKCSFSSQLVTRQVDNGREIVFEKEWVLFLNIK